MQIKLDFLEQLEFSMSMLSSLKITIKNDQKKDMLMNMEKSDGKDWDILKERNSKNKKIK